MRVRLTAAAVALIASFLSTPALSADKLNLAELLERARQNNPELIALREAALSAEAGARAEGRLDDPTFKIELEDLSTEHPLEIGPSYAMLTRYTISQMFPFPGKLALKERMAGKEALAARAVVGSRELEITAMIKEAYFEYAFLDESIKITREIKELFSSASEITGTMYSIGQVTQQDLIKLNVEQAMLTDEIIMLEARKEVAAAGIKSLVNMDQSEELVGAAELSLVRVSFDEQKLTDAALASTPDIVMLRAETEANELGAALAEKNYYPDFMVGVAPVQRDGRFDNYDLMFQVNIPIWWGKYGNQAESAKSKARAAHSKLAAGKNRKALEVKGAAIEVAASLRQIELLETSLVPQAELSYESSLRNYRAGRTDLLMLLETGRDLKRTRTDYLKALFDYNLRLANLERATGVDLLAAAKKD